ncbi:AfsR/SARP family transcriptional regulator [Nonomuraea longicatena]|uniref:AfsR/SARP family transcriptional regulator n=1 Tax=Nonomuraea longicatena TaxID=83682 RepID=UPI0031D19E07
MEVRTGGDVIVLTGRVGALLTVLLLNAGRVVSVQRLAEALWGLPLPNSPAARVRTLVTELRRVVGPAWVLTQRPGYAVRPQPAQLDLTCFAGHVARAREAAPETAAEHLDAALALWRGTPFDGISGAFVEAERIRLEELRISAVEQRAEARLSIGRYGEAATDLAASALAHPLRERLHGQLMRALHGSGRRAEALEVYRRLRERMSDELGLEPERELQRLHQRILTSDREPPERTHPHPTPRELPAPPPLFVGRTREQGSLDARRPITAVSGAGGMGKTWLALHWAHRNLPHYPDGQLYANLATSPETVLRRFLGSLGVHPAAVPHEEEAQAGLYRSLVAGRRLLVVLDNARDATQVTPLLPGSPASTVLITSRHRLTALGATHGANLITLNPLTSREVRDLLCLHLGEDRVAADPDSVAALVEHSGGLPLAVGVLAARASADPALPLASFAAELRSPATRLDALRAGDLTADLRVTFDSSYEALDGAAARMFALLGLVPWPEVSLSAATALAGTPSVPLGELESAHLVHRHRPGRYRTHDLIRLYAAERAHTDLTEDERRRALTRLVDFCVRQAYAADRLLSPNRPLADRAAPETTNPAKEPATRAEEPAVRTPPEAAAPADAAEAAAWFEVEQPALRQAQHLAAGLGLDGAVWRLAWALDTFHLRRYLHEARIETWRLALPAAERDGKGAHARWYLGYAHAQALRTGEGVELLNRALEEFERTGDLAGRAHTGHTLGYAWSVHGSPGRALPHVRDALRLQRELGDPIWEANALSAIGWCLAQLGRYEEAHAYCAQALTLFREHRDPGGESATLDSLGLIAHRAGGHARALGYYRRSVALREALGNDFQVADTLARIGDVHRESGDLPAARRAWQRAEEIYRRQHRAKEAASVRRRLSSAG